MLAEYDPRLHQLLHAEEQRQAYTLNLIASENYIPSWIRNISSSVLTNKYAEGYPGKRFYAGCTYVDEIERMAISRCNEVFNAHHSNVQPHSGSQANMAAYFALASPGDKILGMNLASGGHLTHGQHINFSGTFYHGLGYTVDPNTERLDYEAIADLAQYHRPQIIVAGASAYSREINFHRLSQIAQSVDAYFVADIAHIAGLVAAGIHQSPIPFADCVTSSTHKTLRGPRGGIIMCHKKHTQSIEKAVMPGIQGGPLMQQIAAKALALSYAQEPEFKAYQQQIVTNAQALAQALNQRGYRKKSHPTAPARRQRTGPGSNRNSRDGRGAVCPHRNDGQSGRCAHPHRARPRGAL